MINEEIGNKLVTICFRTTTVSASTLLKFIKGIVDEAKRRDMSVSEYIQEKFGKNKKA